MNVYSPEYRKSTLYKCTCDKTFYLNKSSKTAVSSDQMQQLGFYKNAVVKLCLLPAFESYRQISIIL